jgi:hypothetical protein
MAATNTSGAQRELPETDVNKMPPTDPPELLKLSNLRPSVGGSRIAFTIECRNGDSGDISCAITEISDIINFLLRAAAIASEQSGSDRPAPTADQTIVADVVPALGIGYFSHRDPTTNPHCGT